jgi:hypothetical protein
MGMPISKQTLDREQAYIRSQTSPGDVGYAVTGVAFDSSVPKLSDLVCCQRIYEQIIQLFEGEKFKMAMSAAVAIERALQQLGSMPTDAQVVEASQGTIQESFGVLAPLNEGIAKKITDCVREQAQLYGDEDEQSSIKKWLLGFPGENG